MAPASSDVQTVRVASGLSSPLFATHAPGDTERLFILEQTGRIRILDLNTDTLLPTPFLNVDPLSASGGERGLLGLAFHPDYANNGFFFINYTDNSGNTVVARYTVSAGDDDVADPASAMTLLSITQPFANHNGGWLGFGPDGYLYIGTGDGGSGNDPGNRAQDITNQLLGKILRIDVNSDDFPADLSKNYAIPANNPFAAGGGDPEIWAFGIRNPWRSSFDRMTGDFYIGDVGQGAQEEVNVQPAHAIGSLVGEPGYQGGRNYGWRCMEGFSCTGLSGCTCNDTALTLPVHQYSHTVGFSITGGYVYRGTEIPDIQGRYFFADFISTNIWSFVWDGAGGITDLQNCTAAITPSMDGFAVNNIASFGEDANGEMYIVSLNGSIFRLVRTAPDNDLCTGSTLVDFGSNPVDNTNATASGTSEPCGDFDADVWYRIVLLEDCTLNLSICDATYDTELAIYGFACPGADNLALACSDDDCGTGSSLSVALTGPALYRIRVGSKNGDMGTGTLVLECGSETVPCPWDCAPDNGDDTFGNGIVNIDDLLTVINDFGAAGGPCDNAPDNGDGTYGNDLINIDDLLGVINNFGDCPL
jgi:glucose/arabinose dehydrogenase